jgi:hypothetical protein
MYHENSNDYSILLTFSEAPTMEKVKNIKFLKKGDKPRHYKGTVRYNIELNDFEGQIHNETDYVGYNANILFNNIAPGTFWGKTLRKYSTGTDDWHSIGGIKDIDLDT